MSVGIANSNLMENRGASHVPMLTVPPAPVSFKSGVVMPSPERWACHAMFANAPASRNTEAWAGCAAASPATPRAMQNKAATMRFLMFRLLILILGGLVDLGFVLRLRPDHLTGPGASFAAAVATRKFICAYRAMASKSIGCRRSSFG